MDTLYIFSIDLKQCYWQIPLTERSTPKTAFIIPGRGLIQIKLMPFRSGYTLRPANNNYKVGNLISLIY